MLKSFSLYAQSYTYNYVKISAYMLLKSYKKNLCNIIDLRENVVLFEVV